MSPRIARSVSIALLGGVVTVVLFGLGLLVWAGLIGWAAFIDAGDDAAALKKTVVATVFGASLAWGALVATRLIPVPPDNWLWMLRAGVAVAITLWILVVATQVPLLSRVSTSLYGYAAMFGAFAMEIEEMTGLERLTSLHLYNPFFTVVFSIVIGAVFGLLSGKLTGALSKA